MDIEDNIRIGVAGIFHSGKDRLTEAATTLYPDTTTALLKGNLWVPDEIISRKEKRNKELFDLYSRSPEKYAFPYQMECLANRLACQQLVDKDAGIVLQNQPLAVERATYGEANKDYLGEFFPIYDNMSRAIIARTKPVHVLVYLQVKEEQLPVILQRISASGRDGEKKFVDDPSYLLKLIRSHEAYMKECRIPVISVDATHPAFAKDYEDKEHHLKSVLEHLVRETRRYKAPPRLELWQWEAVDYNPAQQASRVGRRQVRNHVQQMNAIISTAGIVSGGKSGLAEMIADQLDINVSRELSGRNNEIVDPELFRFLDALAAFKAGKIPLEELRGPCYDLQVHLIAERPRKRKKFIAKGKAFIEDRSIEEDEEIFWRLFHDVHTSLTTQQYETLKQKAAVAAQETPQPHLYIGVMRSALEAKQLSIGRGRDVEQGAWSLADMQKMESYFHDFFSVKNPKIMLDMQKFNSDSEIHRGWLWQEMMWELMKREEERK